MTISPSPKEASFQAAKREHTSVLARVEKRTLIWIAERLPANVNSDHLTILKNLVIR